MVHGSDVANTDFPYGMQNVQASSKIALTFKQSKGGTIHTFICIIHQRKQIGTVLFINERCMEQLE